MPEKRVHLFDSGDNKLTIVGVVIVCKGSEIDLSGVGVVDGMPATDKPPYKPILVAIEAHLRGTDLGIAVRGEHRLDVSERR